MAEKLLTVREVAARLRVSHWTVYDWVRMGRGPSAIRVESRVRFRLADVERYEDEQRVPRRVAAAR